jgi:hypothetical protein
MATKKLAELEASISEELKAYTSAVMQGIRAAADRASKEMTAAIVADSPVRTGKYKKSWRVKNELTDSHFKLTTYNTRTPNLTAVLETGRRTKSGKRIEPRPHIKRNEKTAVKKYLEEVDRIIKNGG